MLGCQALDFAFDTGLRRVFDKNIRAVQNIPVQFSFPRTIAANGVDMHASAHHIIGQDSGILLICGAGGDDISPGDGLFSAGADAQT